MHAVSVYLWIIGKGRTPADRGREDRSNKDPVARPRVRARKKTMTMIRNSAIAFTAAIAMTAAASLGAANEAQAGNKGAYIAGGFIAGAIIGNALARPVYAAPAYGVVYAPVRQCWMQKEFVGYNHKGYKVYQNVQVCN